jgi:hypothetical protein
MLLVKKRVRCPPVEVARLRHERQRQSGGVGSRHDECHGTPLGATEDDGQWSRHTELVLRRSEPGGLHMLFGWLAVLVEAE